MAGQVDFLMPIGHEAILLGSTVGQIAVYSSIDGSLLRILVEEGLSIYEAVFSMRVKRMALACDGGMALIYELDSYEKIGQVTAQKPDITSLMYAKDDVLVVGQVGGFMDVIAFSDVRATVSHSLHIQTAGDINSMC